MTLTDLPSTTTSRVEKKASPAGRRFGNIVSIAVNAVMLFIAHNLLDWGWFPWLTEAFNDVLPWITFSLLASMLVSAIYLFYESPWFKSLTQSLLAGISFLVTWQIYDVFPFDFSAYDGPWTGLTEAALIFVMIGSGIAFVVEGTRFIIRLARPTL